MSFIEEISGQRKGLVMDRRKLRNFGILLGIILGMLAVFSLFRGTHLWIYLSPLIAVSIIISIILPKSFWLIYKEWMTLSFFIGYFVSRFILILLYYIAFVPIGIILKLSGNDLLNIKKKQTHTYWKKKKRISTDVKQYEKMF